MSIHRSQSTAAINPNELCPRLKARLQFIPNASMADPHGIIEDVQRHRFFRLGVIEYEMALQCDGIQSLSQIYSIVAGKFSERDISMASIVAIYQWLRSMELVDNEGDSQTTRSGDASKTTGLGKAWNWNPLAFRVPLFCPDPMFQVLVQPFRAFWKTWVVYAWSVLVICTLVRIMLHWTSFLVASQWIFSSSTWLWLTLIWLGLKWTHEMFHGLVCRFHEIPVSRCGVQFLFGVPMPYVDVTACWRLRDPGQRMQVAVAGMYGESWIAMLAIALWNPESHGLSSYLCIHAFLMASLTTFVFNANPLMKFDGYYLLSDFLAIPNLYRRGKKHVGDTWRSLCYGEQRQKQHRNVSKQLIISIYGWASWYWRIAVAIALTMAASHLGGEAGTALAILCSGIWLGLPVLSFVIEGIKIVRHQPTRRPRIATLFAIALFIVMCFAFLPWIGLVEAPAVIIAPKEYTLRAGGDGFVKRIWVRDGDYIQADQVILEQVAPEMTAELQRLEISIKKCELRELRFEKEGDLGAKQIEAQKRQTLLNDLEESRACQRKLVVRAPFAGRIIKRKLELLEGTYFRRGDTIALLADDHQVEVIASIAQEDLSVFHRQDDKPYYLEFPDRKTEICYLKSISPRAENQPPNPSLFCVYGGPLPAKKASSVDGKADSWELIHPRLECTFMLENPSSSQMLFGQRVTVFLRPWDRSLGSIGLRWLKKRLTYDAAL